MCEGETLTGVVVSVMDVPCSPFDNCQCETTPTLELDTDNGVEMVELNYPGLTWEPV